MIFLESDIKNLTELQLRRIINVFRGCGKSVSVFELAKKNAEQGKSTVIVSNYNWDRYYRDQLGNLIKVISASDLVKELKNFKCEEQDFINDPAMVHKSWVKCLKDYDYVLMDPAIYEELIFMLMNKLTDMTNKLKKLENIWREY